VRVCRIRRLVLVGLCVAGFGVAGLACSDSKDDSGASTNLDEIGPQIAKLRLEVQQLRQEVRTLREEVALVTPVTDPDTGLPLDSTSTTTAVAPGG
jgi:outer membrane murein-binding lipoprotein Lpp